MENKKSTLYFAVYVSVANMSKQSGVEAISIMKRMVEEKKLEETEYNEKYYIIPCQGDSRIELLYPSPFLTEEQTIKYFDKYKELIEEI